MNDNPVQNQINAMDRLIQQNLSECCKEILEYHGTSILKDGIVRKIMRELPHEVFHGTQLVHVENAIKRAALVRVAMNNL